jgi:hypothetical protein
MILTLAYVVVLTWPFSWSPPDLLDNGARFAVDGKTMHFTSPGLIRTIEPPPWLATAKRTGELQIALRVRPVSDALRRAAPFLSVARNGFERNLAISQLSDDLILSMRTPRPNGEGDGVEPLLSIRDVFRAGEWLELELKIKPGELTVAVDDRRLIQIELAQTPLLSWNTDFELAFGNEITGGRPWLGDLEHVVVDVGNTKVDYPQPTGLERPGTLLITSREPKLQPFRYLEARDVANNLVLYVPLGFFLGISRHAGGRLGIVRALTLVAGLSGLLELAQLFVFSRNPSIIDFILNLAGGMAGFLAARWLATRLRVG